MPNQEQLIAVVNQAAVNEGVELVETATADWVSYRVQGDHGMRRRVLLWNDTPNGAGRVGLNRPNDADFGLLPHVGQVDWVLDVVYVHTTRITYTPASFADPAVEAAWLALFQQVLGMANPGGNAMPGVIP